MSWSVSYIGSPEAICKALDEQSTKETGQSKIEFDAALPHLKALVMENFHKGDTKVVLDFSASGSGYAVGLEQKTRDCNVKIQRVYTTILT